MRDMPGCTEMSLSSSRSSEVIGGLNKARIKKADASFLSIAS